MKNIVENQCIKTDKPLPMSYEALKAERDALAVENQALNKSLDDVCNAYENGQRDLLSEAINKATNLPTPATDAAIAAIQAQGVEKAAKKLYGSGYVFEVLMRHAAELREAK
ncbi:hypothetical protein ACUNHX_17315 [Serratia sp. IR-2025]|nr:hypothetical protein [Serratia marcescens]MBN5347023.1 hypothetical protein [Serratia marcescens]